MDRFVFVEPEKYNKVYQELNVIIEKLHKILKDSRVCTFQEVLIGSGKYGLVTYDIKGNKGFDFDFNLVIQNLYDDFCDEDGEFTAQDLKYEIMDALKEALIGTNYKNPKDSTSVLTIKVVDSNNSKILYGADFAIIYEGSKIKHDKNTKAYIFEGRTSGSYNEIDKIEIIKRDKHWDEFRTRYLEKKNASLDKKSSSIRRETTNDIWMKYYN